MEQTIKKVGALQRMLPPNLARALAKAQSCLLVVVVVVVVVEQSCLVVVVFNHCSQGLEDSAMIFPLTLV